MFWVTWDRYGLECSNTINNRQQAASSARNPTAHLEFHSQFKNGHCKQFESNMCHLSPLHATIDPLKLKHIVLFNLPELFETSWPLFPHIPIFAGYIPMYSHLWHHSSMHGELNPRAKFTILTILSSKSSQTLGKIRMFRTSPQGGAPPIIAWL